MEENETKLTICSHCDGTGKIGDERCIACHGDGVKCEFCKS